MQDWAAAYVAVELVRLVWYHDFLPEYFASGDSPRASAVRKTHGGGSKTKVRDVGDVGVLPSYVRLMTDRLPILSVSGVRGQGGRTTSSFGFQVRGRRGSLAHDSVQLLPKEVH